MMKDVFSLRVVCLLLLGILSGCGTDNDVSDGESQVIPDDEGDLIENSTFSNQVIISLGTSVEISNPMEGSGVSVTVDGNYVTVNSSAEEMEYIVTGSTVQGAVKIYSDYKFKLTLDDVSIINPEGPALNIQSHKRVFVELVDGTSNYLADGFQYTESGDEDMKATFFSEGQLIFNGTGTLEVEGNYKHAICSDDYVRFYEGNISITRAVKDGIHTNDAVIVDGGSLSIVCASDAIECEEGYILINAGDIMIESGDEGITTSYEGTDSSINPYMEINGGNLWITTTGSSAKGIKALGDLVINDGTIVVKTSKSEAEGIESKRNLTINGGTIEIEAYDDCINAATDITITGGKIYCYSATNDGIDSNGTLTISGGTIVSIGSSSPEEGFDCDQNTFTITGGTLLGLGSASSTPTGNVCKQPSLLYGGSCTQDTFFHIVSSEGDDILTFKIPRTLRQMTLLYSSPAMTSGSTYSIYTGGSITGGTDFYGLYEGAAYTGGTEVSGFTINSMVTTVGNSSGQGGPNTPGGPINRPGW